MDPAYFTNFTSTLTQQESLINVLQQQVSTGIAVSDPSQNPGAFESATIGTDQISALYGNNNTQATIQTQLGSVSNAYQSVSGLFDNVQAVIEQALNGTTSALNLKSLAGQVSTALQSLVAIGNTTGPNNSFLFGGTRGGIKPFQTGAGGDIVYLGDGGQSNAAISPSTSASTIANGDVFTNGLSGNGYASVSAASTNSGAGLLLATGISNPAAAAAFQASAAPITLSFSSSGSSGLTYTATQSGTAIATGAVAPNMSLQLAGVSYQLSGSPAAGDSFTLAPSRPQSAFSLLQNLVNTLSTAGSLPAQVAQTNQQLNNDLASLTQYQQSVVTAQAQIGVTLQAVSAAGNSNSNQASALTMSVQNAVAVNMPAAITSLNETLTGVQAAMKAFGDASKLSLFNYI